MRWNVRKFLSIVLLFAELSFNYTRNNSCSKLIFYNKAYTLDFKNHLESLKNCVAIYDLM